MKFTACPHCDGAGHVPVPGPGELRAMRREVGCRLVDMALVCGRSVPYLSQVERGERRLTPHVWRAYQKQVRHAADVRAYFEQVKR